jgi:hypothetical protein
VSELGKLVIRDYEHAQQLAAEFARWIQQGHHAGLGGIGQVLDYFAQERAAPTGWRTMDSAPIDEPILMLMKHGAIEGTWDGETGRGYYWHDLEWYAKYWMPLTPPPSEGNDG